MTAPAAAAKAEDPSVAPWRAAFEQFVESDPAARMGAVSRGAAFERFAAHGLPTRRDEYWKYTPVRDLTPAAETPAHAISDPFAHVDAFRLVFVDGRLDAARSDRAGPRRRRRCR